MESLLFSRIGVSFSPAERFLALKRWEMRFRQNVLGILWKARFVQFSWKTYCFHVLAWFQSGRAIFGSITLRNAIWSKRPPRVLKSTFCTIFIHSLLFSLIGVNFSPAERFLVLKRWEMQFGEFPSRRAIFGSETLRNAIWLKRPPHRLKSTFSTIFLQSLLFSRNGVNFGPAERFLVPKRWEMRFGRNVHRMALKHVWYNFLRKPTVFTYWR